MKRVGLTFKKSAKIRPYDEAVRMAGLEPVRITPQEPRSLAGLSGLVMTGGSDVNPARYGQAANGSEGIDDERDNMEADLLAQALAADLPVLAICRGVQFLNVAHGGTLIQHLPVTDVHDRRSSDWQMGRHPAAHAVEVARATHLASIFGPGAHEVNSRHHQAADRVGASLVVSAVAPDGVIEGLERTDRSFVVGVQWHPEDRVLVSEADRRLFEAFAAAVEQARRHDV